MATQLLLILTAYLFGSLSSAIIICRLAGLPDPRGEGSGNPGATNVLRFGGKKFAAMTLVGDLMKGVVPMLIAHAAGASDALLGLVGLAAFLGHLYPVFFRFQGGKGVATAVGVLIGLHGLVGLATAATWLVMLGLLRISSLAALTAAALSPLFVFYWVGDLQTVAACTVMSVMLFWRHRANIRRLLAGAEPRVGKR